MASRKTLETTVEIAACKLARQRGWLVRKLGWLCRKGAPDRIFMKDGTLVYVEFKAPGEQPRFDQLIEHAELAKAGFTVQVVECISDMREWL